MLAGNTAVDQKQEQGKDDPARVEQEMERVASGIGIPPRPGVLVQLSAESGKDEPDFKQIEKLISSDVGLSAALLKTVNSPFYGLRNKASSVSQAVNMLGLSTLSRVVTGLALKNTLGGANQISMERFWDASAKVALVSSYIAKQVPGVNKDEAYTYGLFQDCGIPVLMGRFPNYKDTLAVANKTSDRKFTEVEDAAHGVTHATVGYLLAKSWSLPTPITQAIRFHHEHQMLQAEDKTLSAESRDLMALALLAERAIQVNTGLDQTVEWDKCGALVLDNFGFTASDFEEIIDNVSDLLHEEGL